MSNMSNMPQMPNSTGLEHVVQENSFEQHEQHAPNKELADDSGMLFNLLNINVIGVN